jgi:hypothetical protein
VASVSFVTKSVDGGRQDSVDFGPEALILNFWKLKTTLQRGDFTLGIVERDGTLMLQ